MKNKNYIALITITVSVIVVVIISNVNSVRPKNETIKIGVIAPLTGNVAFLGEGLKNAVKMAETELTTQQGNKQKYEVLLEDNAFDVNKSVSAANKLVSIDHVSALVTLASAAGNAVNPIAEKNHIIHFGIASDPNVANGQYNFIHWTPPSEETKIFVPELIKRGYRRVAILGTRIQGITAVINSFEKDIQGTDIKEVDQEIFDFGTTDFRTLIAKAETKNPDIYVLFAFSPELDLIAKQMREKGIKTPITSIESFEQSDHPELYEGLWYVNAADSTGEFNSRYETRFGKPPSLGAGNAYDIVRMIGAAAEKVHSDNVPTSEQISKELYNIHDMSGALGTLNMNSDGLVLSKAVVRVIKNEKPVTIGQ